MPANDLSSAMWLFYRRYIPDCQFDTILIILSCLHVVLHEVVIDLVRQLHSLNLFMKVSETTQYI